MLYYVCDCVFVGYILGNGGFFTFCRGGRFIATPPSAACIVFTQDWINFSRHSDRTSQWSTCSTFNQSLVVPCRAVLGERLEPEAILALSDWKSYEWKRSESDRWIERSAIGPRRRDGIRYQSHIWWQFLRLPLLSNVSNGVEDCKINDKIKRRVKKTLVK